MMTGLYPDETRVYNNKGLFRDRFPDIETMPQRFQRQGHLGRARHSGVSRVPQFPLIQAAVAITLVQVADEDIQRSGCRQRQQNAEKPE